MRLKSRKVATWRLAALAALVGVLALSGAAKVGLAGTTGQLTPTVTVLNDVSALVLGTPTPGKNIGYDLNIANGSTNTLNHLEFTDTIGSNGKIVYLNAPAGVSCSGTVTLSCTTASMAAGAQFDVIVLFQTDPNGTGTVDNILNGTYAPASQNTTNHRTDPTKTFTQTTSRLYADTVNGSLAQSLSLPTDSLSAAGPGLGQTSSVKMPPGFVNSKNYVGVTLQNLTATTPPAACTTCLSFRTDVHMPLAVAFSTSGPFWNNLTPAPFSFSLTIPGALLPNGFKPTVLWHRDDAGNSIALPNCADTGGLPPTSAPGICVSSLTQNKQTKDVFATGLALSNGSYWIG